MLIDTWLMSFNYCILFHFITNDSEPGKLVCTGLWRSSNATLKTLGFICGD